ncbi:MAG: polysaccharide biosynthesis C-terminal domain-containing protein, partial [Candidatus Eremiobacteraeota bacterium]|nr:polysaccharide biosynthesis C-terminal domain-containing protein [Candidatus Eremiobacteraeota bacterium]
FALIVLAHPMVQALFERGTFQASATDLTASLLPYAAVGLIALAANVVLTRCCFACHETLAPVTISVATVVLNVLLSLVWLPSLGARGLLLANSVSQTVQAALLLMVAARLVSGIDWRSLAISGGKVLLSSFAMLLALGWIGALGVTPEASLASRAWFLFGQIAIGATVFIAAARVLGVEELELAWRTIVAKFERNLVSPPENREAPIA